VNQKIVDLRRDANEEFVEKAVFLSVANRRAPFSEKSGHFSTTGFFWFQASVSAELQCDSVGIRKRPGNLPGKANARRNLRWHYL